MDALSDPEQVGYGLGVVITTLGGAGLVAFFYVALTVGKSRGRGWGHLGARWLRATGILFVVALEAIISVTVANWLKGV